MSQCIKGFWFGNGSGRTTTPEGVGPMTGEFDCLRIELIMFEIQLSTWASIGFVFLFDRFSHVLARRL